MLRPENLMKNDGLERIPSQKRAWTQREDVAVWRVFGWISLSFSPSGTLRFLKGYPVSFNKMGAS